MDVNAFGLAAGRKHAKARRPLPNAFLARNVNPRKSNDWFGKSPRRFASLRRSRCARHDTAVLHMHRRLQPALDVEQHPRAVRMMTDRLEQPLPIDTVEVTFDVDVEPQVVAPPVLTSVAYGIDRRSAGPVAVGLGMEHRFQTRLQVPTATS